MACGMYSGVHLVLFSLLGEPGRHLLPVPDLFAASRNQGWLGKITWAALPCYPQPHCLTGYAGPASPSFLAKLILWLFAQVRLCAGWLGAYDLTAGCPALESEDLMKLALLAGELGGHPAGLGPASVGGVDQDGLADGGELVGGQHAVPCYEAVSSRSRSVR